MSKGGKFSKGFAYLPVIVMVALVGLMIPTVKYVTDPNVSFNIRQFAREVMDTGKEGNLVTKKTKETKQPVTTQVVEEASDLQTRHDIAEREVAPVQAPIAEETTGIESPAISREPEAGPEIIEKKISESSIGGLAEEIVEEVSDIKTRHDIAEEREGGVVQTPTSQTSPNKKTSQDILPGCVSIGCLTEGQVCCDGRYYRDPSCSATRTRCQKDPSHDYSPAPSSNRCFLYGMTSVGFVWCPPDDNRMYSDWVGGDSCESEVAPSLQIRSREECERANGYWSSMANRCFLYGMTSVGFVWLIDVFCMG